MDESSLVALHEEEAARTLQLAFNEYHSDSANRDGNNEVDPEALLEAMEKVFLSVPFLPVDTTEDDNRIKDCAKRFAELGMEAFDDDSDSWKINLESGLAYTERYRKSYSTGDLWKADGELRSATFRLRHKQANLRDVQFAMAELNTEHFLHTNDHFAANEAMSLYGELWNNDHEDILALSRCCLLESMLICNSLNPTRLENFLEVARWAIEEKSGHADYPLLLEGAGWAFLALADIEESEDAIENAATCFHQAINASTENDIVLWRLRRGLGGAVRRRFLVHEKGEDLEETLSQLEQALSIKGLLRQDIISCRLDLAEMLCTASLYRPHQELHYLDLCGKEVKKAEMLLYRFDTPQWIRFWLLESAYKIQACKATGRRRLCDETIEQLRTVCNRMQQKKSWATTLEQGLCFMALGDALSLRGPAVRVLTDIEEAISNTRQAVKLVDVGEGAKQSILLPVRVTKLSGLLRLRFEALKMSADLQEAATLIERASLYSWPLCLKDKVEFIMELGAVRQATLQEDELSRCGIALDHYRAALQLNCKDTQTQYMCRREIAQVYNRMAELRGQDINAALIDYEKANESLGEGYKMYPETSSSSVQIVLSRFRLNYNKWKLTGMPADGEIALESGYKALETCEGDSVINMETALRIGNIEFTLHKNRGKAAESYRRCVEILNNIVTEGHSWHEQKSFLLEWSRMPTFAAICDLDAGAQPVEVLRQLEKTRSLIWERRMNNKASLDEAERVYPDMPLIKQLKAYRARMLDDNARDRAIHARNYVDLLKFIRKIEGFENFQQWDLSDELLMQHTQEGPLVVFVHCEKCYALISSAGRVRSLELPLFNEKDCRICYSGFQEALRTMPVRREAARSAILIFLKWLWYAAAEPVLRSLGLISRSAQESIDKDSHRPRIWWVTSGWASVLPIHAAGDHAKAQSTGEKCTVIDAVVSSYTPTIRALEISRTSMKAFSSETIAEKKTALMVALEKTMDKPPKLPHAPIEVERVESILEESFRISKHVNPGPKQADASPPTHEVVREGLQHCTIAHFACHAEAEQDPMDSILYLKDWYKSPFKVASLMSLDISRCQLAYLSACESAVNTELKLREENLHISGALQMAGIPNTVATWWRILDEKAVDVAADFYSGLKRSDGEFDINRTARALDSAVRMLRESEPDVFIWGAFVHFGC